MIRRFVLALAAIAAIAPLAAVDHLKRGDRAPAFDLLDLDGRQVRSNDLAGHVVILVFGELYHAKTLSACEDLRAALDSNALADKSIRPLLVVGQDAPAADLAARAADAAIEWPVLRDSRRRCFGAYRVSVLPSVVVIDGGGRVVHALAGYGDRFTDICTDALLVAVGLLGTDAFERTLHPQVEPADPRRARAARLTNLAGQLARRGLAAVARDKYAEALEELPDYAPARLGLGSLDLREGRLAEAEQAFREVVAIDADSLEARLSLAYVLILRGGSALDEAESILRALLTGHAGEPRAHYLMGLAHEQRGESAEAARSFRTAAELLMSRRWELVTRKEDQ